MCSFWVTLMARAWWVVIIWEKEPHQILLRRMQSLLGEFQSEAFKEKNYIISFLYSNISQLALQNFKGTVSESYLLKINKHWLKFPPQSPSSHYILAIVYFIMSVFGLTGNFLVIFIYIKWVNVCTFDGT